MSKTLTRRIVWLHPLAAFAHRSPGLTLFVLALGVRVALLAASLANGATSLTDVLNAADGRSYAAVARTVITGVRPVSAMDERVFPGWPLVVAVPGALVGYELACVALSVLLAAAVPPLFLQLTGDFRLAAVLAVVSPAWLMHSVLGMSEPVLLFFLVWGILAFARGRILTSAVLVAIGLMVRPHAVAVVGALAYVVVRQRRWAAAATYAVAALGASGLVVLFNLRLYGDPLRQVHLYGQLPNIGTDAASALASHTVAQGHWGMPFLHLVMTPIWISVPSWKLVYIWLNAAAALAACWVSIARRPASDLGTAMAIWAVVNTALIAAAGPYWGFFSFDRYVVWALPAYLYALGTTLTKGPVFWGTVSALSIGMASWGLLRHF